VDFRKFVVSELDLGDLPVFNLAFKNVTFCRAKVVQLENEAQVLRLFPLSYYVDVIA